MMMAPNLIDDLFIRSILRLDNFFAIKNKNFRNKRLNCYTEVSILQLNQQLPPHAQAYPAIGITTKTSGVGKHNVGVEKYYMLITT